MSDERKNRCLGFIVLLICLSSCGKDTHRFRNYPEIITKYQLEDLHDRAKWEVYKLNTLYGPGYLVKFETDSILRTFEDVHNSYRSKKKNFLQDTTEVQGIVGKNNTLPFPKAELALFPQDSSEIFRENEIVLSFFPERDEENRWESPLGRLCYSIIFSNEGIVGYGCGDYVEWEYSTEEQEKDDQQFIQLLKEKKYSNPWLDWYLNKREH